MCFGVVRFYCSAEAYAATNGYGEGDYHEMVERSVPATPLQIVGELEAYAEAIGASQHEPVDWPPPVSRGRTVRGAARRVRGRACTWPTGAPASPLRHLTATKPGAWK